MFGLVHQHNGNVIDDGIDTATGCAAEAILRVGEFHLLLTGWTNEHIQEFLSYRHMCNSKAAAYSVVQLFPASRETQVPSSVATVRLLGLVSVSVLIELCHGPFTIVQVSPASEL